MTISMVWETRQNRLRDLLGANDNLCFQVYIGFGAFNVLSSKAEYDAVAYQDGWVEEDRYADSMNPSFPEDLFYPGWAYISDDYTEGKSLTWKTQHLLTIAPFKLDSSCPELSNAARNLKTIAAQYIPAIESAIPELDFTAARLDYDRYANKASTERLRVEFKYSVSPYDPGLCHPRHLGVLEPITLLDGHAIHTSVSHIDDLVRDEPLVHDLG